MNEPIIQLSTRQLLDGSARYLIPMYQRNYAWEEAEISQLIQDVLDAMRDAGESPRDYYLGSLVVDRREDDGCLLFETLDGQQRLTTLSLLMLYLKKHLPKALDWLDAPRIEFENRPRSTATVAAIAAAEGDSDGIEGMQPDEINSGILAGYRLVRELLPRLLADDELSAFAAYLFDHVQIMRVEVPEHTDLNHYFEVMNNRGEQLEKHEVLKARLLEALSNDPAAQACLHQVWEACANMEKYVQMGFAPTQREQLFDNDNGGVKADGFDDLATLLAKARGPAGEPHMALRRDPPPVARSCRNPLRRRRERAVDARRLACQMAPRAHDLVFRNLHPARSCRGVPPLRRALSLSLQQLL